MGYFKFSRLLSTGFRGLEGSKYLNPVHDIFLVFVCFGLSIQPASAEEVTVLISQIPNQQGLMRIALYDSEKGYETSQPVASRAVKPAVPQTRVKFDHLKALRYAILVHQDLDENGLVDKSFFGIPQEPVGFSNNPSLRFGKPGFSEVIVDVSTEKTVSIILKSEI